MSASQSSQSASSASPRNHVQLCADAIKGLGEVRGSSRDNIAAYLVSHGLMDEKKSKALVSKALYKGRVSGVFGNPADSKSLFTLEENPDSKKSKKPRKPRKASILAQESDYSSRTKCVRPGGKFRPKKPSGSKKRSRSKSRSKGKSSSKRRSRSKSRSKGKSSSKKISRSKSRSKGKSSSKSRSRLTRKDSKRGPKKDSKSKTEKKKEKKNVRRRIHDRSAQKKRR